MESEKERRNKIKRIIAWFELKSKYYKFMGTKYRPKVSTFHLKHIEACQ
jgi:hypothetical protein